MLEAKPRDLQLAVSSCHELWCLGRHLAPVVCPLVRLVSAGAETQEGPQTQSRRVSGHRRSPVGAERPPSEPTRFGVSSRYLGSPQRTGDTILGCCSRDLPRAPTGRPRTWSPPLSRFDPPGLLEAHPFESMCYTTFQMGTVKAGVHKSMTILHVSHVSSVFPRMHHT